MPLAPQIGSPVLDRFVAAVADDVAEGAGEAAHKVAERFANQGSDEHHRERERAGHLLEKAIFDWSIGALKQAGEQAAAAGLASLSGAQASYVSEQLRRGYASALAPDVDAAICCNETADGLCIAGDAGLDATSDQLVQIATHAGKALAAAFRCEAVLSLPDEVATTLEDALKSPRWSLTWD